VALEDYRPDMERCSQCSYCKFIPLDHIKSRRFSRGCPSIAYSNFNAYSARGRFAVALSLLKKQSGYTERVQDIVFKCDLCGSCDVADKICRYNLEPLQMMYELRARLVEEGHSPPQHESAIAHLRQEDNMTMKQQADRGDWAEGLDVKLVPAAPAEVLFHAGCRFSYDKALWPTIRNAVSILKDAGIDIGVMGRDEPCCGVRAYYMGYKDDFARQAKKVIKAWRAAGVKTVVTSCADGFHAFLRLYPQFGGDFEVLHTVQYIDRLIKQGKLKLTRPVPLRVTYHDPCHLGRQGEPYVPWKGKEKKIFNQVVVYAPKKPRYNGAWGVYEAPRDVLKAIPGLELVEMERIKEYAWCCGAGGGAREAYPEYSGWTAAERLEEARSTGAEAIVSACGWCERNFLDAVSAAGDKMQVFDIVDLVKKAMPARRR
jgi:Fe-S oxidoreductase